MRIRAEEEGDREAIRRIHQSSFPTLAEAELVDRLRDENDVAISLVAEEPGAVIGHVLFSRLRAPFAGLGLGPVAVLDAWRRQGIAARLIEEGLAQARDKGWEAVFVLGDPAYYRRVGFDQGLAAGFSSPYAGAHFMACALKARLPVRTGSVDYSKAFAALG